MAQESPSSFPWETVVLLVQAVILAVQAWLLKRHGDHMEAQRQLMADQLSFQKLMREQEEHRANHDSLLDLALAVTRMRILLRMEKNRLGRPEILRPVQAQLVRASKLIHSSVFLSKEHKEYFDVYIRNLTKIITRVNDPNLIEDVAGHIAQFYDFLEIVNEATTGSPLDSTEADKNSVQ